MVHGDGTRADGRRFRFGAPFVEDGGLARPTTRAEHLLKIASYQIQNGIL